MFNDKGWPAGAGLAADELPVDPSLPQLAGLLDREQARRLLAAGLDGNLELERADIGYVAYRPGRSILVAYRVRLVDDAGRSETAVWTAKAFADERDLTTTRRRRLHDRPAPDGTVAPFELPGWRLLVTPFPDDIAIRGMYRAVRSSRLGRVVRRLAGDDTELVRPTDARRRVEVVSFKPERSCLVRSALARGDRWRRPFYARVYHNERGADIHAIMQALWLGSRGDAGPPVARPLGYDPATRILCQLELDGRPLGQLDDGELLDRLDATARSLALLHASPVETERRRTPAMELELLDGWLPGLAAAIPTIGRAFERVTAALRRTRPDDPARGMTLIHGDFSRNQVIADGDRHALIDLDAAGLGDPLQDLASFIARLDRPRSLGGVDPENAARIGKRLCRRYEVESGVVIDRRRLAWLQAAASARIALNAVKHLRPGWRPIVDRALDRAAEQLAEIGARRR